MTSKFIQEDISMLFCSEKFSGWVGGDIAIIAKRFEIDLGPGPELDNTHLLPNQSKSNLCLLLRLLYL